MKFELNRKFFIMVVAALISSCASFPYGFKFSFFLHLPNELSYLIIGSLFGVVSCLANAILGSSVGCKSIANLGMCM